MTGGGATLSGLVAACLAAPPLLVAAILALGRAALAESSPAGLGALAGRGHARARQALVLRDTAAATPNALALGERLALLVAIVPLALALAPVPGGVVGLGVAMLGLPPVVLLLGMALPRFVGRTRPDRLVLALAPLLTLALAMLVPLARAMSRLGARARPHLGRFGAVLPRARRVRAEAALRGSIAADPPADPEARADGAMLRSILDLAAITVDRIMVPRNQVVALDIDQPPTQVLHQALSSVHSRIPLYRGSRENIVGVLQAKALLRALRAVDGRADRLVLSQIAMRPWFIPETTTLLDQLHAFRRRRERFAVVVDEYGVLVGVVTLEDILEEIVGGIAAREGARVPGVRPQGDDAWLIDGAVALRDLNREFDWGLPDGPAVTIAGLVLHESRAIPEEGQVFVFHGFRFDVLRRKRHQIALLRVARDRPAARDATA